MSSVITHPTRSLRRWAHILSNLHSACTVSISHLHNTDAHSFTSHTHTHILSDSHPRNPDIQHADTLGQAYKQHSQQTRSQSPTHFTHLQDFIQCAHPLIHTMRTETHLITDTIHTHTHRCSFVGRTHAVKYILIHTLHANIVNISKL